VPKSFKQRAIFYSGFFVILIFYFWIYFVIFPNSSLSGHWLGGSLKDHCLISAGIGYRYLIDFLLPWRVDLVPGTYCPPAFPFFSLDTLKIALLGMAFFGVLWKLWKSYKSGFFFLFWFLIFYIPVSNLIPLANPMAMRFMYLPSVGMLASVAIFLDKAFNSVWIRQYPQKLSFIFRSAVIILCIVLTLILNVNWKNDLHVAFAWMEHYPEAPRAYLILAHEYDKKNRFHEARQYYEKAFFYGDRQPQEILSLGICYMKLGELEKAKKCFLYIISVIPDEAADPYIALGDVYHMQKDLLHEQSAMEKALTLAPQNAFIYNDLMRLYGDAHKLEAAKRIAVLQAMVMDQK